MPHMSNTRRASDARGATCSSATAAVPSTPTPFLASAGTRPGQDVLLGVAAVIGAWLAAMLAAIACGRDVLIAVPYVNFIYGHLLGQMAAARHVR